jgi:hypothetical protein
MTSSSITVRSNPLKTNQTRIEALNNIGFCWNPLESKWNQKFKELRNFQQKYGHTDVPLHYAMNPKLGSWVAQQRIFYRQFLQQNVGGASHTDLSNERLDHRKRIEKLNSIGFCWSIYESTWNQRYNELLQFQHIYGHTDVPQKNTPLGPWVSRQRYFYRQLQQRRSSIPAGENPLEYNQTRIAELNRIGFCWNPQELKWNQRYNEVKEFQHKYGHTDVPLRHPNHRKLGVWVNNQRLKYKSKTLSMERIAMLQQLNFSWVTSSTEKWYERYEELCKYQRLNGNTLVPTIYADNPALGYWVNSQRVQYKKYLLWQKEHNSTSSTNAKPAYSRLTPDRMDALNRIGFQWQVFEDRWNFRYQELCTYKKIYGNCNVPQIYPENQDLANWVVHQRTHYRYAIHNEYTTLTPGRMQKLQDVGFCWHYPNHTWYEMFNLLKTYIEKNGGNVTKSNQYIPSSDEANRPLRIWLKNQRYEYSKLCCQAAAGSSSTTRSLLTPDRLDALNSIGFKWEGLREAQRKGTEEKVNRLHPDGRIKKHWFDGVPRPTSIEWDTDVNRLWHAEEDF